MIRVLLWLLLIYAVIRFVRTLTGRSRPPRPPADRKSAAPFSDVEDAEFEDLTPKPPPENRPQTPAEP